MTTIVYTTTGSVRGTCGHKHRSIRTAYKCVLRDHRGCVSQGGYSDRHVVAIEDVTWALAHVSMRELDADEESTLVALMCD